MANRINLKLDKAEELARVGLMRCETESEKKVWLYTFSDPYTNSAKVSKFVQVSPNTARKALNA